MLAIINLEYRFSFNDRNVAHEIMIVGEEMRYRASYNSIIDAFLGDIVTVSGTRHLARFQKVIKPVIILRIIMHARPVIMLLIPISSPARK